MILRRGLFLSFILLSTQLVGSSAKAENVTEKFGISGNVGYATFAMDGFNNYIDEWYVEVLDMSMEHIKGGLHFSGDVKYRLPSNPNIYLMCSAGYMSDETNGSTVLDVYGNGSETLNMQLHVFAIPVLLTGLYILPKEKINVYLGGGTGYYLGKVKIKAEYQPSIEFNQKWKWNGSQIGFHILSGAEYSITSRLLLSGNLIYRWAKIDELKNDEGKMVRLGLDDKILKLDFSGLEIRCGVVCYF
jgi:opacity protein-like surface antigen